MTRSSTSSQVRAFARWRPLVLPIAVLALGIALRLPGLTYGLPFPLVSDEEILIGGALRMAQTRSFIPTFDPVLAEFLYYPVGIPYALLALFIPTVALIIAAAGFPPISEVPHLLVDNIGFLFLQARFLSLILGAATIWVVYCIGTRVFASSAAGVVAAMFLATSWYHVLLSQVARHWSATTFLIWFAVLIGASYYAEPTRRRAVAAGLTSALGFAVSFIGILGFVGFLIGHITRYRVKLANGLLFQALGVLVVGCGIAAALHLPAITRLIGASPVLPVDESKTLIGLGRAIGFYALKTWFAEPTLIVVGVVGTLIAVWRAVFATGILVLSVAGYLVFLYIFLPLEDRYILPAVPAFALLAGGGFAVACEWLNAVRLGRTVLVAGIIGATAFAANSAWTMSKLMDRLDTRLDAAQWVQANLPEDARLVVATNPVKLPTVLNGLKDQIALDAQSLDLADRLALEKGDDRASGQTVVHLNRFPHDRLEGAGAADLIASLRDGGYRYFVLAQRQDLRASDFASLVRSMGTIVARFDPAPGTKDVFPPDLRTTHWVHDHAVARYSELSGLGPRVEVVDLGPD